jgi:hypothetical protein
VFCILLFCTPPSGKHGTEGVISEVERPTPYRLPASSSLTPVL